MFLNLTDAGPAQCHFCVAKDPQYCTWQTQDCLTDPFSHGTTHCASGEALFLEQNGFYHFSVAQGCFNCTGKGNGLVGLWPIKWFCNIKLSGFSVFTICLWVYADKCLRLKRALM